MRTTVNSGFVFWHKMRMWLLRLSVIQNALVSALLWTLFVLSAYAATPFKRTDIPLGLNNPWSLAWLPDGSALITERSGRLLKYKNKRIIGAITGLPKVYARGQGGLLDVALHPQFAENGWIYITYALPHPKRSALATTALMRFRLHGMRAVDQQRLFVAEPWRAGGRHFGSRMVFDGTGYLYMSIGDRGERQLAQDLKTHMGKVIRLHEDGRLPQDNPFINTPNARAEIYSYGHRNAQGMIWHKGYAWLNEHGPRGGDELNKVHKGANYGWPIVSFGREYVSRLPVSKRTHQTGITPPLLEWSPSIAPSGMALAPLALKKTDEHTHTFFVGSLKFGELVRVDVTDTQVSEARFFTQAPLGRIRHLSIGPNDALYVLLDEANSPLIVLTPRA